MDARLLSAVSAARHGRRELWPFDARRWAAGALTLGVLGPLVVLALVNIDVKEVARALSRLNAGWLALAWVLTSVSNLARGESWFAVIRTAFPERAISRIAVTRSCLAGAAASSVVPGRLGEGVRAWLVARRLGDARKTLATVAGTILAQTLLNLLALLILMIVALAASTIPGAHTGAVITTLVLPAMIVAASAGGPRLASAAAGARSRRARRLAGWVALQLGRGRRGLIVFRRPLTAAHAAGAQLSAWVMQLGCCYAVILALGLQHQATPGAAAAVLLVVNLTAILPVTPSNVGVYQAACIAALAPFGISAGSALAYGLSLQAVEVLSGLLLGLPALAHEGLSLTELRRQPPTRETAGAGEPNLTEAEPRHCLL